MRDLGEVRSEERPRPEETPRERTLTDHLNQRLLASFLGHLNTTDQFQRFIAESQEAEKEEEKLEDQHGQLP